jgi:type IV pilus assembly protein PilC
MAKIGTKRLEQLCRRVGIALRAGVDIRTVWKSESQRGPMSQRAAMAEVLRQISTGHTMADAMKNANGLFPPLTLEMVEIGERTGQTDAVMLHLADHYDNLLRVRRSFLTGIAWPVFELAFAIAIIGFMILILGLLNEGMGVFGLSGPRGLVIYLLIVTLVLGALTAIGVGLIKGWFGPVPLAMVIRTPMIGTCLRTMALSRMAWSLSMALNSGMDARRAMRMAVRSTQSPYYTSHADRIDRVLAQGGQFHESLRETGVFPDEFADQLEAAELAGTQTESLEYLANEYRQRAEAALRNLTIAASTILGGLVLITIGFVVIYLFWTIYIKTIYDAMEPI